MKKKGYEGKELIFGIRPEDVNTEAAFLETFPESVVKATISVSELLGSESHLYCQVGDNEFIAKVDARDYLETGATIELGFDLNKAHFFDKETEKNSILINTDTIETETICLGLFHSKETKHEKKRLVEGEGRLSDLPKKASKTAMEMVLGI